MTAFQVLLHELAQHGVTTYERLMARYAAQGYTYEAFTQAVQKARRLGIATHARGRGRPIVATGACPCCGRKL